MSSLEDARWESDWVAKQAEASVRKFNQQLDDHDQLIGFTVPSGLSDRAPKEAEQ